MDLNDFVVRFHPGIVKSFERDKNQKQPPLSAPGDLVFTQEFKETKFPFPPKSPSSPTPSNASIDLLEVIPETELESTSSPTPTPSEASTNMGSPTKVIPETQFLSQSPNKVLQRWKQEDMIEFQNRIEFECLQDDLQE